MFFDGNEHTHNTENYKVPFYYKSPIFDITKPILWYHKIDFVISQIIMWYHKIDTTKSILWYHKIDFVISQRKTEFVISQNLFSDII